MITLLNQAAQNVTKNVINGVIAKLKISATRLKVEDVVSFLEDINLGVFEEGSQHAPSETTSNIVDTLRRLEWHNTQAVKIAFQTIDRVPDISYNEETFDEEVHLNYLEVMLVCSRRNNQPKGNKEVKNLTAKHNHNKAATHRDRKNDYDRNDYTPQHDLDFYNGFDPETVDRLNAAATGPTVPMTLDEALDMLDNPKGEDDE